MESFDRAAVLFLNQFVGRSHAFDHFLDAISSVNLFNGILLTAFTWYLWFRNPERRALLLSGYLGVVAAGLLSRLLQLSLHYHARPFHTPSLHFRVPLTIEPAEFNRWSSFPSDHAAVYGALATLICFHSRRLGCCAWLWTIIVLLPRTYLGYHWPSDLLGGIALGALCVILTTRPWIRPLSLRLLDWESTRKPAFYTALFLMSYEVGTLFADVRRVGEALAGGLKLWH